MPSDARPRAAELYVAWLVRRRAAIFATAALVQLASIYLTAFHLPLHADFSHLLPQDAPAVRDLRRLEARVTSQDTLLVVVEAPAPAIRADVARELAARIRALPAELV